MITKFEYIPVTADSHPFARAADKCDFEARGYVEQEYFIHGTANVYTESEGGLRIAAENAPYVNRFLARFPEDPGKASGRVIVEILNATTTMDIDRIWMFAKEEYMRNGDAYIGISSKPAVLKTLKKFDPKRYAALHWGNPRMDLPMPAAILEESKWMGALEQESEAGLLWDMLGDLAEALRAGNVPIPSLVANRIYLAGWSQSACCVFRYVTTFTPMRDAMRKAQLFDGYVAAGGMASKELLPGVNQYESSVRTGKSEPLHVKCAQPFVTVQTESENHGFSGLGMNYSIVEQRPPAQQDSDETGNLYRIYDIPGSTHDNKYNMIDYYRNDLDLHKVGIFLGFTGAEPYPNDYPYELAFCAIFHHLYAWAEKGIVPPRAKSIQVDTANRNVRDIHGNAVGGWRLPFVDLPVAAYIPDSTPLKPQSRNLSLFGYKVPFSKDKLIKMYGSLKEYYDLVEKRTDELIDKGFLLAPDRDACISLAVKRAIQGGLE